ncbi:MAG TPA: DNA-directed RNA polymerase subunit H [Thermoplasmata archaeon]|nr:DNA-directed RNA polymerase subunit H [Thermoplasmata archaeon]
MRNKRRHELVPEHRVLSGEEAEMVLKRLKLKREQLPKISVDDPIAKEIGAKVGDIVEIRRPSPTAGYTLAYRYTIKL